MLNFLSRCLYRFELLVSSEAREKHRETMIEFEKLDRVPAMLTDIHRRAEEIEPGFWARMDAEKRITHPWLFN